MFILSNQAKFVVFISSIFALIACNQPTKTGTSNVTSSTSAPTPDSHADHTMHDMANSTTPTQPDHVTAYMQAMTAMHEQMSSASNITNPDVAFATGMIAHHQGAINMAKIQLQYGKDSQLRTLAENIIKAQQAEISQMQNWLAKYKEDKASNTTNVPKMDMKNHDAMMQGVMANDPDVGFVKGMIPHHQGAIDMADIELKTGKDKEMLALAKSIKLAQDPEIKQMQAWLEKNLK